jgi:hypothetical protein
MTPDFHKLYPDLIDAECCHGYYDGRRPDSPEPSSNRHPAYIHGFVNGRDDAGIRRHSQTAEVRRRVWALIVATCSDDGVPI